MCGIAGIFHTQGMKPVDPARLQAMGDVIAHRGPDGEGIWTAPGVGLGHRRLSIIDLAGSPQPMASTDGSAMLVFNGEIYNYRELRRELQALGAQFHTDGDSEVILAAWQHWGPDCLARFNGMFAFALYDLRARTLLLARDRFGVKPLHMATLADGSVIFGSELKQLMAHPMLRRTLDPLAVEDYLAWGFVPDHRSIFAGVRSWARVIIACCATMRPRRRPSAGGRSRSPSATRRASATSKPICSTACARRSPRAWLPTCRWGPSCRAGSTVRPSWP
jgi:asparagine synthase (glutamine-hydrolysing)